MEIYDDLIKEGDEKNIYEDVRGRKYKRWQNRLHKSAGWVETLTKAHVFVKNGKKASDLLDEEIVWDVCYGDGSAMTVKDQVQAEILSKLVMINERLKRLEEKIDSQDQQR